MNTKASDNNFLISEMEDELMIDEISESTTCDIQNGPITHRLKMGANTYTPIQQLRFYEPGDTLEICQRCLHLSPSCISVVQHRLQCDDVKRNNLRRKIYFDEVTQISVYCISGDDSISRRVCQVGMCFLKSKTVYLDSNFFIFYVVFLEDEFAGFFSREKDGSARNNLSCIVVLPMFRKRELGLFLVDLSYKISVGTPERPFSAEGLALYDKYWEYKVVGYLQKNTRTSLQRMCKETRISKDDLVYTLDRLKIPKKDSYVFTVECAIKDYGSLCRDDCFIHLSG